jgi:hypothetical protein
MKEEAMVRPPSIFYTRQKPRVFDAAHRWAMVG